MPPPHRRLVIPKFRWCPLPAPIEAHIQKVLDLWVDTPYRDGQQVPGVGTDCVRFVTGCIDMLFGRDIQPIPKLPNDACLHDRESAMRVMRIILELYQPLVEVTDFSLEPADIIIVGPPDGGPGHAMFAGVHKNSLYQATRIGVQRGGVSLPVDYCKLYAIYRCTEKESWVS